MHSCCTSMFNSILTPAKPCAPIRCKGPCTTRPGQGLTSEDRCFPPGNRQIRRRARPSSQGATPTALCPGCVLHAIPNSAGLCHKRSSARRARTVTTSGQESQDERYPCTFAATPTCRTHFLELASARLLLFPVPEGWKVESWQKSTSRHFCENTFLIFPRRLELSLNWSRNSGGERTLEPPLSQAQRSTRRNHETGAAAQRVLVAASQLIRGLAFVRGLALAS